MTVVMSPYCMYFNIYIIVISIKIQDTVQHIVELFLLLAQSGFEV